MVNDTDGVAQTEEPIMAVEGETSESPTAPGENEQVSDETTDDGDWTAEYEKKGPEGLVKEARRMREKIARLERERQSAPSEPHGKPNTQPEPTAPKTTPQESGQFDPIAYASRNPEGKADIETLRSTGLDDSQIKALLNTVGRMAHEISGVRIEPIASEFREGRFSKAIEAFAKDERFKFGMSKPAVKADVESYIRKTFKPEMWTDPEVLQVAYGLALANHQDIFTQGKREIVDGVSISEKPEGNAGGGDGNAEVVAFAKANGMDYDTKENRQIAKSAYMAYKATLKKGD